MGRIVKVECHSGYTYAEKPVAFEWEGSRLEITSILSEALTPEGKRFRVRVKDNREFELFYAEKQDIWECGLIKTILNQ